MLTLAVGLLHQHQRRWMQHVYAAIPATWVLVVTREGRTSRPRHHFLLPCQRHQPFPAGALALTELGREEDAEYPLILGIMEDGRSVTLHRCYQQSFSFRAPGFPTERVFAHIGFLGAHFEDVNQLKFRRISLQYSYLPEWTGLRGIQQEFTLRDNNALERARLTYSYPDEVAATTPYGTVTVIFTFKSTGDLLRQAAISQLVQFRVEPNAPLDYDLMSSQFILPLQNLLSLAMNRPNAIVGVSAYPVEAVGKMLDGSPRDIPVDIVFEPVYVDDGEPKSVIPNSMLFSLADVRHNFSTVVESWIRIAGELDSVCSLFFSVQYRLGYVEHRFINTVQAIESYHRRRFKNAILSKAEYRKKINSIVNSVNDDYKSWLKDKLSYGNEPSLIDRLQELYLTVASVMNPLVNDRGRFLKKVRDTRNYYTHYDKRLANKAVKGAELYSITDILGILLQGCLLRELGFTSQQQAGLFGQWNWYQFLQHRTSQEVEL